MSIMYLTFKFFDGLGRSFFMQADATLGVINLENKQRH